jgi:hypothetical protein
VSKPHQIRLTDDELWRIKFALRDEAREKVKAAAQHKAYLLQNPNFMAGVWSPEQSGEFVARQMRDANESARLVAKLDKKLGVAS